MNNSDSPLSTVITNPPAENSRSVRHSEPPGVVCRGCCLVQVPAGTELSTHWPRLLCWRSGRAQRTADYDSHCWTVRGLIMESVGPGPRYYNYLQYNTYYQLFSSTPDTDHKQPNYIITILSISPNDWLQCSSGVGGSDCRITVMMLHQLAGLGMRVSRLPTIHDH